MFVSGNPTLPSKTPPTLKFLLDFEKNYLKMEKKNSKKTYIFMIFIFKNNNKKKNLLLNPNQFFSYCYLIKQYFILGLMKCWGPCKLICYIRISFYPVLTYSVLRLFYCQATEALSLILQIFQNVHYKGIETNTLLLCLKF